MRVGPCITSVLVLSACAGDKPRSLATAAVDTLPGGIVSMTSSGPTAWIDSSGWRLVEDGRIGGELGTPGEIIDPKSLAVDDAGRVYVSDDSPTIIKVFAPDGSLIRTIGREGEGPGEFRAAYIATLSRHLIVHDPSNVRTSVFDTSGTFIRSWNSTCCFYDQIGTDAEGRIYVPLMSTPETKDVIRFYIRFDTAGVATDTVGVPSLVESKFWSVKVGDRTMMSTGIPLAPREVHAIDPAGGLLFGWSGEYRIVQSNTGADTVALFGRAWTPEPLAEERRRTAVEGMIAAHDDQFDETALRNSFPLDDVPTTLPAYQRLSVDPSGNVWVLVSSDSTTSRLDVFDPDGAFLGPVVVPAQFGMMVWGQDAAYALRQTEDGVPYITRYRIERPSNAR